MTDGRTLRQAFMASAALAFWVFSGPVSAQEGETPPVPPENAVPLPEDRPAARGESEAGGSTGEDDSEEAGPDGALEDGALEDGTVDPSTDPQGEADPAEAPTPERRPAPEDDTEDGEDVEAEPAGEADDDDAATADEREEEPEPVPLPDPEPEDRAALAACRAELREIGAIFEEQAAILPEGEEERGCGVAKPFNVSEIVPGVALEPDTQMRCETALALARMVRNEIQPAAAALPEFGAVTAIQHGSTYVCRGRNGLEDAKISEHAKGNAIDIMSFTFENGESLAVTPKKGDGNAAEAFQAAVRGGACLHFTTVLGPGSDAYHNDHLHLDVAARNGGYRLCQ